MTFEGVTPERLQREVGTRANDPLLAEVIAVSHALVLGMLGDDATEVPDPVFDQAHLAVAVDMFNRRKAPNGVLVQQFEGDGATAVPIRLSNDPLRAAYPILSSWLLPAIGGAS